MEQIPSKDDSIVLILKFSPEILNFGVELVYIKCCCLLQWQRLLSFVAAAGVTGSLCGMCCRPISDRFLLRIMDISYHEQCVQCCACGDHLQHTCFVRHAKLYCRLDYDRWVYSYCILLINHLAHSGSR